MTRPRGKPPTPRAASTEIEPLEITETGTTVLEPRRRIEPFPNCFSSWHRVWSNARRLSFSSMEGSSPTYWYGERTFPLKNIKEKGSLPAAGGRGDLLGAIGG